VTATVRLQRDRGGEAISSVRAVLRHDFAETEIDATLDGDTLVIDAAAGPGQHTLAIDAMDAAGHAAQTVLRPFWIEAEPFDWRDAVNLHGDDRPLRQR
jgi:hypothetical protein